MTDTLMPRTLFLPRCSLGMAHGRHNEHTEIPCSHYSYSNILATWQQDLCLDVKEINTVYRVSNYVGYPKSDRVGIRNATWLYEVLLIPFESGTVWKTRCCVRRHRSCTRIDIPVKKMPVLSSTCWSLQRYTYRHFLIIFGSWNCMKYMYMWGCWRFPAHEKI